MADLNALMIFAKIIDANSFSEAARRLKMPTSTLSRRIAELEDQLGVRLLTRSTRSLRPTEIGTELLEHARSCVELSETIDGLVSNQLDTVTGLLRLSAPPSISDSLLTPLISAFQSSYPAVRVQLLVTDRLVDHVSEGVDLAFRVGVLKDSALVAKRLLSYRHQLVASPAYIRSVRPPRHPQDLLEHRLLAFSHWTPRNQWHFTHVGGQGEQTLAFQPAIAMNDYSGLIPALLGGAGIGDLPPVVQPGLVRDGHLVEVMPEWRLQTFDLSLVHAGRRHLSRPVRAFKECAAELAPTLFPDLPT